MKNRIKWEKKKKKRENQKIKKKKEKEIQTRRFRSSKPIENIEIDNMRIDNMIIDLNGSKLELKEEKKWEYN